MVASRSNNVPFHVQHHAVDAPVRAEVVQDCEAAQTAIAVDGVGPKLALLIHLAATLRHV